MVLVVSQLHAGVFSQPPGMNFHDAVRVDEVRLLIDECWVDGDGKRHVRQEIFSELHNLIQRADQFLVLDMFLINNFGFQPGDGYYPLSDDFTRWLVEKKRTHPDVEIILISDPLNTVYGSLRSPHFEALRSAGVTVVLTDLDKLPDSNPLYSIPWRLSAGLLGSGPGFLLPNPVGEGRISVRSALKLLNMKANHRKTALSEKELMVMSANPHSGSSAHWNSALHVRGAGMKMLYETEKAVLKFSGLKDVPDFVFNELPGTKFKLEILTEGRIRERIVKLLDACESGGRVDVSLFYLSDVEILASLIKAHQRGCFVRVILDPNKDAFGRQKNGMPNRQSAASLRESLIPVRWAKTSGEQFHVKMLYVEDLSGSATLLTGSANFTRRNVGNFNAETMLALTGSVDSEVMQKQRSTFQRWWDNSGGRCYTCAYKMYADENLLRRVQAWFQEVSGLSSF